MAAKQSLPIQLRLIRTGFSAMDKISPRLTGRMAERLFFIPRKYPARDREREVLAQANRQVIKVKNEDIQLYRWGTGSRNAWLVHGWEGHAGHLGAFVSPLVEQGYSVWSFDAPAHGASTGRTSSIPQFAEVLHTMLDLQGSPELLVAHSMGSAASMYFALQSQVHIPKAVFITSPNRMGDVLDSYSKMISISSKSVAHLKAFAEQRIGFEIEEMDVSKLADSTQIGQALYMHDRKDKIIPFAYAQAICDAWDKASLIPMEGKGHYRILWDDQTLAEFRKFIGEVKMPRIEAV
ncbi:alpha/beta hydrolase [Pontibacter sp. G13]|uniref:alpha/beta hydrolase n=1 Tax=Pontibacter sp. G13 TaxID=3074898 RepID=UPI00288A2655|nr:alpha/beta hydrolase [Pontibacter sp. G13]WNJ17609.1 alpha/beta hydrolase [Pontibacter sp. G13]